MKGTLLDNPPALTPVSLPFSGKALGTFIPPFRCAGEELSEYFHWWLRDAPVPPNASSSAQLSCVSTRTRVQRPRLLQWCQGVGTWPECVRPRSLVHLPPAHRGP